MKQFTLISFLILTTLVTSAQSLKDFHLYDPKDDPETGIAAAVKKAKAEGKHVFIQAGGNWCIWCMRFDKKVKDEPKLDSTFKANFVVYHLNYSKENMNEKTFAKYGYPQRFGFPVFLILDAEGKLIHTQNSEYLENNDDNYLRKKISEFFSQWGPKALDPAQYKEQ